MQHSHKHSWLLVYLPLGITLLVLTVQIELIVRLDSKLPSIKLFEILGVDFGRIVADREPLRVNERMKLAAPGKRQHDLQRGSNGPQVTCTDNSRGLCALHSDLFHVCNVDSRQRLRPHGALVNSRLDVGKHELEHVEHVFRMLG